MRRHLLDASALLALIRNEPGEDRVKAVLDDSAIHAINLAEVVRKMISKGMSASEAETLLADLNLDVIESFSEAQAYALGRLTPEAQRLGLSLGDCVCLTVAASNGATAMTAERRWSEIKGLNAEVVQIR